MKGKGMKINELLLMLSITVGKDTESVKVPSPKELSKGYYTYFHRDTKNQLV